MTVVPVQGNPPLIPFSGVEDLPRLKQWINARYATRGLDPQGTLFEIPYRVMSGSNAQYMPSNPGVEFGPSITFGRDLITESIIPSPTGSYLGAKVVGAAGHEAGHAVDKSLANLRMTREPGAIAEHVGDMLGYLATDVLVDRPAAAKLTGRVLPHTVNEFVTRWLDHGGVHSNVAILNDAMLSTRSKMTSTELGRLYVDVLERLPRSARFTTFAAQTVESSKRLFGESSKQAQAVLDGWHGVEMTDQMMIDQPALRDKSKLIGAWFNDWKLARLKSSKATLIGIAAIPVVGVIGAAIGARFLYNKFSD